MDNDNSSIDQLRHSLEHYWQLCANHQAQARKHMAEARRCQAKAEDLEQQIAELEARDGD